MKIMINLLPATFRKQQLIRRRIIQWGAALCVLLMAGWMWHLYELRESLALAHQLQSLEREHEPSRLMLRQLMSMRQQLDDLQHQELVVSELEHQRNALTLLGLISQATQATAGRCRVTKLELTRFQEMPPAGARNIDDDSGHDLLICGVSLDNPAVAELLEALQDSGLFRRVELSVKERRDGELAMREYEMRCAF